MPKMKTNSSAKKRFKVTGRGKVKFKQAHSAHRLMQKPKSMKRKAKGTAVMHDSNAKMVLDNFMPYSRRTRKKNPAPGAAPANKGGK